MKEQRRCRKRIEHGFEKVIKTKTVAIVGASEKPVLAVTPPQLSSAFQNLDNLYLVNPRKDSILGQKAYHSLLEIDGDVDLVILCTPPENHTASVKEAAEKTGGAVVFARWMR